MEKKIRVIPQPLPIQSVFREVVRDAQFPQANTTKTVRSNLEVALSPLTGIQVTESESHPAWRDLVRGRFHGDIGGNFTTTKRYCLIGDTGVAHLRGVEFSGPTVLYPQGSRTTTSVYTGPYLPLGPAALPWPTVTASTESQLAQYGTTAIARCSPSNPTVDLAVTIGEVFKDGIPKLVGSTLGRLRGMTNRERRRAIGSEYLNVEFGWKPFLNDLRDACRAIVDSDEIISQYERDSGRLVRRSYDFPEVRTSNIQQWGGLSSPWISPSTSSLRIRNVGSQGKVYRTEQSLTRRWFRGAFSYYVPEADSLRNSLARDVILARKLLGISLTPDTLWNLTPWSWMFDWFSNTGDVIQNWSSWAIDNQVLMYGYIMEHKISMYTYTFTGPTGYQTSNAQPSNVTLVAETKVRRKATPYGFGLNWSGLSPRQLAITAALGLTKS